MGPLVLGETEGFVSFTSAKERPFFACWAGDKLSRFNSVSEAMRAVEAHYRKVIDNG